MPPQTVTGPVGQGYRPPAPQPRSGRPDILSTVDNTTDRALTPAQEARRQRVIDAAMSLALEGGYDAVQMRDVATRANVAMGTVYRYFSSKDHLLAASAVFWFEQLEARLSTRPALGATPAERVTAVLDRALRSLARQPLLGTAVFAALSSPDPAAVESQLQISSIMERIVAKAIGEPAPDDVEDRSRMIGHVWYSALSGWVNGWSTVERVYAELEIAADLLLPADLMP